MLVGVCVPRTSSLSLSSRFPEADLNIAVPTRASMIARCGPRTGLLDPHSPAGLAGAARTAPTPQRTPRSWRCDTRSLCCAAPILARRVLARPRCAQRPEQAAARTAAPGAAGVATHTAALARAAGRPALDLSASTTRSTTHATADPDSGAADGPRESPSRVTATAVPDVLVAGILTAAHGLGRGDTPSHSSHDW